MSSTGADVDLWDGCPYPPRAWQAEALPVVLDALRAGVRGIVSAVMGAGKSVLQARLCRLALPRLGGRAIVVCAPRTALVRQLSETIAAQCGEERVGVYYGARKQADRDVIVVCAASLGRLTDELAEAGRRVAFLLIDEAHGSEAAGVRDAVERMRPVSLVGFTATPFRSVPSESLGLFDRVLYRYTMQDAIRDGVLVPMRYVRCEGEVENALDSVCMVMMRLHGRGPGIVSARDCADADAYAEWLTAQGFAAESIHSGHTDAEREDKIARLRRGDLRVLVHVSLLAEGVDFPWLRWLCLRRAVQARVRFLQEIGRPMRTMAEPDQWGPKTEAVVMDPLLLLGRHGLTTSEAIGQALEEAAEAVGREAAVSRREPTDEEALSLDVLLAHLGRIRDGLGAAGMCKDAQEGGWRLADVSERQVEALKRASKLTRHAPPTHRETLRTLLSVPWVLTRGDASDLLDVLYGAADWAREFVDVERGVYPNQVQWSPELIAALAPSHAECLAAGRAGRKMGVDGLSGGGVGSSRIV
jgi:hypothetical protein